MPGVRLTAPPRAQAGPAGPEGPDLLASAEEFIALFHDETRAGPPDGRLAQVRARDRPDGTYRHTAAELEFGARVAWRNSSRCIGRLYWQSLRVRDRREVTAAAEIAAECRGPPAQADQRRPGPAGDHRLRARYAPGGPARGFSARSSSATPATRRATARHRRPGQHRPHPRWPASSAGRAAGARPVRRAAAARAGDRRRCSALHELPADAVLEVPLRHPEFELVRRPGAALVRRAGHQRHVPGRRRHLLPGRAVQRLVHGHRDRVAQSRRHRPLRPARR